MSEQTSETPEAPDGTDPSADPSADPSVDQSTPATGTASWSSVVVVGGGLAAAKTAEALRDQGYTGTVVVLSGEDEAPYERPPLSKDYLKGEAGIEDARVQPQEWYDEHDVELRLGSEVTRIDRDLHQVELADGSTVPYGALVLATGSEARALEVPGVDRVLTLRDRGDSDAIRETFGEGRTLLVVGAGWIGLEVAAAATQAGTQVVVVESAEQPLLKVLGPELGALFADLHRDHGVDLRLGVDDLAAVVQEVSPDAVVAGVGARPRTELAEAAGLELDEETGGVQVDAALRTSDPAIVAVGDIAAHDHPTLGQRIRVEHWANALNQPATAVAALLGQEDAAYDRLPYFYSDQFDLGMEYVGHAPAGSYARVVERGDHDKRELVAFWLDDQDRILAAMAVNVWDVLDDIRPLIADRTPMDPERLADPETSYADARR